MLWHKHIAGIHWFILQCLCCNVAKRTGLHRAILYDPDPGIPCCHVASYRADPGIHQGEVTATSLTHHHSDGDKRKPHPLMRLSSNPLEFSGLKKIEKHVAVGSWPSDIDLQTTFSTGSWAWAPFQSTGLANWGDHAVCGISTWAHDGRNLLLRVSLRVFCSCRLPGEGICIDVDCTRLVLEAEVIGTQIRHPQMCYCTTFCWRMHVCQSLWSVMTSKCSAPYK